MKKAARLAHIKRRDWGYVQPPIHLDGFSKYTFEVLARQLGLKLSAVSRLSPLDPKKSLTVPEYRGDFLGTRLT